MKPKFGYWDVQGLGQPCRMVLHYASEDYEDTCPSRDKWWTETKFTLGLPMPNLPYYIDGDLKLTQSNAILRHLGRKYDLYGKSAKDAAEIDMLIDMSMELRYTLAGAGYNPNFETLKEKVVKDNEPKFKQISEFLGDKSFLIGDQVSIADFTMHDAIAWYLDVAQDMMSKYDNLIGLMKRFEELPRIKSFLGSELAFDAVLGPQALWRPKIIE